MAGTGNKPRSHNERTPIAWTFWKYDWKPVNAADYRLMVCATDGTRAVQSSPALISGIKKSRSKQKEAV
jgi:hypothetical protein